MKTETGKLLTDVYEEDLIRAGKDLSNALIGLGFEDKKRRI